MTPQSTGVLRLSLTLWGHNDFSIYLVPEGLLHNVLNKAVPLDSASSFRATLQSFYELSFGSTYLPGRWDNLLFFQQDLPVLGQFAFSSLEHKQTCGNCCLNSQRWVCLSKRSQFAVSYFILFHSHPLFVPFHRVLMRTFLPPSMRLCKASLLNSRLLVSIFKCVCVCAQTLPTSSRNGVIFLRPVCLGSIGKVQPRRG